MIYPTSTDIIECIAANLDDKVAPHVQDAGALSALATIRPMLRLVGARIRHEGAALLREIRQTRGLLTEAAQVIGGLPDEPWISLRADMADYCGPPPWGEDDYPDLIWLGKVAGRGNEIVQILLQALCRAGRVAPLPPDLQKLREAIRKHLIDQLETETQLIVPTFSGIGPRR
ncbi:MAG: hypothetical protein AB7D33_15210 [Sphingobium sp.]